MSIQTNGKTALILGATGAAGKAVLKELLLKGKYERIITVGRRPAVLGDGIPKKRLIQKTIDFEKLEEHRDAFKGVNDVFCCLGTPRGEAGGTEQFLRIDQGYVLNAAKVIAEENKTSEKLVPIHFIYCSCGGASKYSPFLYLRSKGQTEEGLINTGFSRVSIFRPGGIELESSREKPRHVEAFFLYVLPPISRAFNLHLTIPATSIATAMRKTAETKIDFNATEAFTKIFSTRDMANLSVSE